MNRKHRRPPLLAVLAWLALAGCQGADTMPPDATPAPEVAAALDMADELEAEWGAAPWSPPGWPLKVGDRIGDDAQRNLHKRFPGWFDATAVNWVDDIPFGALIFLRGADSPTPWTYYGHFPTEISPVYKTLVSESLPPHLRGRNVDHLYKGPGTVWISEGCPPSSSSWCETVEDARERWHEPWLRKYADGPGGAP